MRISPYCGCPKCLPAIVALLFLVCFLIGRASALTPKERELVNGLTKINTELRREITANEAAISQKDTDYLFLQQRNEAQAAKLALAQKNSETQTQDLLLAQGKVKALEADRDAQTARAVKAEALAAKKSVEAHRNATERDICLIIAAVFGTVLVMTYSSYIISWIVKIYPPAAPFGIGLEIAIAVVSFSALYGAGRGFLALVYSRL